MPKQNKQTKALTHKNMESIFVLTNRSCPGVQLIYSLSLLVKKKMIFFSLTQREWITNSFLVMGGTVYLIIW